MLPPVDSFKRRTIGPGVIIFLEGQPADAAYVVLKGEAQVVTPGADGTQIVLNRMKPGQMFGEIALLQRDGKRTATIISEEGCELIQIDRSFFDHSLNKADSLLRYVVEHLCQRIVELTTLVAQKS